MIRVLMERMRQGHRTCGFPGEPAEFPARFRGRPTIDAARCRVGCADCVAACPVDAIRVGADGPSLDMGRCVFCPGCVEACPEGAIAYTREPSMASRSREGLVIASGGAFRLAGELDAKMRSMFGRSLQLRQVSAGGCNGCEQELVATGNVVFDLSRFGIRFVASPRHADGIVVTGPVTANMRHALLETYAAVPPPKLVIVVGACAISGGVFRDAAESNAGVGDLVPVDLYIPGCPPHPITVLDGLLRLLGRIGPTADQGA